MKLLSREQIENLSKFKHNYFFTTSLYLDTDKSRLTKKEIDVCLKNLLQNSKHRVENMEISKHQKESLLKDLDKIKNFSHHTLSSYNFAGLAVFSCNQQHFWQEINLPSPPRNRIIFDQNPYLRPLFAILEEHKRICTLVLDRKEARWYKILMGDITLLDRLEGNVPGQVKEGGWEGYESKRIERHIDSQLHDFFKQVAHKTFNFFKKNHFEWFFIGSKDEYIAEFDPLLHPYLKERKKGRLKVNPSDSPTKILKESQELEKKYLREEETELVHRFISEKEKNGLAVSGLRETLKRLNRGEPQILVVMRNFSSPGQICPHCQLLWVKEKVCPSCRKKTEKLVDVVDEAIEAAWNISCRVKQITPPSELETQGKIGALLRYKS